MPYIQENNVSQVLTSKCNLSVSAQVFVEASPRGLCSSLSWLGGEDSSFQKV